MWLIEFQVIYWLKKTLNINYNLLYINYHSQLKVLLIKQIILVRSVKGYLFLIVKSIMDCGSTVDKSLRAGLQAKMWQHLRGKLVCGAKFLRGRGGPGCGTVCGAGRVQISSRASTAVSLHRRLDI